MGLGPVLFYSALRPPALRLADSVFQQVLRAWPSTVSSLPYCSSLRSDPVLSC